MSTSLLDAFVHRHIGPRAHELPAMLDAVGAASLEALVEETVPASIRLDTPLDLPPPMTEDEVLAHLRTLAAKNRVATSCIGLGYYDCHTPSVIRRCIFENPSWYTPYTPYQSEIAQGRLEALLNFQTMVVDLTGMEVANASLLDEGTAAAEAMTMMHRIQNRRARTPLNRFFVSDKVLPQTLEVLQGRAEPLGIELAVGDWRKERFAAGTFGALIQYPDCDGDVHNPQGFIGMAHEAGAMVAVATDLLALVLLTPPGEFGADIVLGSAQRFGVPMGFGGPHAAFFATRESFVREAPGRIIGVSVDAQGRRAYRMSLQTREQHIRREKAKSNICTAQALLATIAGMYAVYHGPEGLRRIARRVHKRARVLDKALQALGLEQHNAHYFDTLRVELGREPSHADALRREAEEAGINFRYITPLSVGISLDETTRREDVVRIVEVFARALGREVPAIDFDGLAAEFSHPVYEDGLVRRSPMLAHEVFNRHHAETQMMRYIKQLERKDLGLDVAMIPLGSCTMKLNAATEMTPVTWPEFGRLHPFAPASQTEGYRQIIRELETYLQEITGLAAVSLQPNSGAQGEYAGLLVIRAYHRERGESRRDIVLIPSSAHGTNPASAVLAGFEVVVVACDSLGNIDVADLEAKAEAHQDRLAALMITYPSTHGVFEESVGAICRTIHRFGGQVYMDGANLNAQVGLTSPGRIGADVCHMNLHKTFSIPHGGGGPGMGPIAVAAHLAPYLPGHPLAHTGGNRAIPAVSAAPWGSASILLISYAYIRLLGGEGCTSATQMAILNANYLKARLQKHYDVLFCNRAGRVAHEMIFDLRPFKLSAGVTEEDVAKRLMDYGFHAPTVSWPVPGTMMIEPTESEPKEELDRFCEALISIRAEIQDILDGKANRADNPLKHAPHTAETVLASDWPHAYSREQAAYPVKGLRQNKFWPSVGRVDNSHGDKNLVCSCPPLESYQAT